MTIDGLKVSPDKHYKSAAMKHALLFMLAVLRAALLTAKAPAQAAATEKPNVLLIISDDQGFGDFGFNGNQRVRTSQRDRLVDQSVVYCKFLGLETVGNVKDESP